MGPGSTIVGMPDAWLRVASYVQPPARRFGRANPEGSWPSGAASCLSGSPVSCCFRSGSQRGVRFPPSTLVSESTPQGQSIRRRTLFRCRGRWRGCCAIGSSRTGYSFLREGGFRCPRGGLDMRIARRGEQQRRDMTGEWRPVRSSCSLGKVRHRTRTGSADQLVTRRRVK